MKAKTIILGVAVAVFAFGIGLGIPMISHAGFEISSYDQAKTLVDDKKDGAAAAKAEAEAEANVDADAKTDSKDNAKKEEIAESDVKIDDDIVVLDWDYYDWAIADKKMGDSDFSAVVNNLEFSPYTDPAVAMSESDQESNGLKAIVSYRYWDETRSTVNVYYDGNKYMTDAMNETPSDLPIASYIYICNSAYDPFNWDDHWQIDYETDTKIADKQGDLLRISHNNGGLTLSDRDEISKVTDLPFIGGNFGDLDSVMKISEMMEKGEKDESASREDYERYTIKTNLGECVLAVNHYENAVYYDNGDGTSRTETAQETSYWLSFEDYELCVCFRDGNDQAIYVNYYYYPEGRN